MKKTRNMSRYQITARSFQIFPKNSNQDPPLLAREGWPTKEVVVSWVHQFGTKEDVKYQYTDFVWLCAVCSRGNCEIRLKTVYWIGDNIFDFKF
jgi:hypothetical protein